MSKFIKTIEKLNERAKRKGIATINKTVNDGMYTYSMVKKEVYRIEHENGIAKLFHYGTLTATVNIETKELLYVYGQSVSDSDSVGTFLQVNEVYGFDFGYKPVNGGFYARFMGNEFDYKKLV